MNTKIKTVILLAASMAALTGSVLLNIQGLTLLHEGSGIDVNCVSTVSLPALPNGAVFEGSVGVQMLKNNTGVLDFAGTVATVAEMDNRPGRHLILQRSVSFDYKIEEQGVVYLTKLKMAKHKIDNVPDDMFIRNIFDPYMPEKHSQMRIINNAILLGNAFSPTNLCVAKVQIKS